jgi:serine/threonine-protein kinase
MTAGTLEVQGGAPLSVLQPLGGDARHEAFLVEGAAGQCVLKVVTVAVDAQRFVSTTRAVAALAHVGLRKVHDAGLLADGRPFVLTDVVTAPFLPTSLPAARALEVSLELASALAALHAAGLVLGTVDASVLLASHPAALDPSLCALAQSGATPDADARALATTLRQVVREAGPLGDALRFALEGARTTSGLQQALQDLANRAHAPTGPTPPTVVVEVVEPDLSGNLLGSWQLEKVLGEGAMGRVYLATHPRIGRRAAVKVLKAEHATNAELVHRFIQEAQAVNAIKNEHIVEVYDFGELAHPGGVLVYCVMELLEGEALADTLNRGPISLRRVAHIGVQLGRALNAAHQVGVVHRDVKPENIMLTRRGEDADFVKVLDFGVAKLLKPIGDLPTTGTLAGIVVGTPEYMAPEQALGGSTDLRSDLYAAGLVLYELLTGTQPFHGDSFGKLVVEMTQKPVPKLPAITRLGEAVPRGLAAVIDKLLRKEPEARYQSGTELAEALEPFTRDVLPPEPPPEVADEVPAHELVAAEELAAVRPSRAPLFAAAAAVLVLLGVGLGLWVTREGTEASAASPAAVAPAPAPPTTVLLEVNSTPLGAQVTRVDTGQVLGVTPLKATVAVAAVTGLTLALDGFEPERRDVNLSTDVSLSVDLKPRQGDVRQGDGAAPDKKKGERKKPGKKKVNNDGTVDPFAE